VRDLKPFHDVNTVYFAGKELYPLHNMSPGRGIGYATGSLKSAQPRSFAVSSVIFAAGYLGAIALAVPREPPLPYSGLR